MKLAQIQTSITNISGIGPAQAKLFANLNVFTISDLLQFYPRDWEDRTHAIPLIEFSQHKKIHTAAIVLDHEWFGFGRMRTLKIRISDGTTEAALLCFNRGFLEKSLPINSIISVTGHFYVKYNELQSSAFEAIRIAKSINQIENSAEEKNISLQQKLAHIHLVDSAVFPIYPLTAGLTQKQIRKAMNIALKEYGRGIENELSDELIKKYNLLEKQKAIHSIHQPQNMSEALAAKRTLIFEELYKFQLAIVQRAQAHGHFLDKTKQKKLVPFDDLQASPHQKLLLKRLEFDLTPDQKTVISQMNLDIDTSYTQNIDKSQSSLSEAQAGSRLLQGDVGSGKTLAAFFAALRVIDWGGQVAFLAPTEILAKQHAENAAKLLETTGVKVAFLTGNIKAANRKPLLKALKAGDIDIVIGTHALFSNQVVYKDLRLAIIDEQHRFGVVQRNQILEKGRTSIVQQKEGTSQVPNLLMMSATPIPQTLALTVYGDLDVSTIKTMPPGRKPIETHLTIQGHESRVYEAVRKELKEGHQAYFVYPLIEQSESNVENKDPDMELSSPITILKSATEQYDFLSKQVYPEFKCGLVHSKIAEEEQSRILEEFKTNKIQILIATTVVEVGVDVPNASCMVIEHAERFGLAALHQLRGRVGRGTVQSHCFLIYSQKLTELGKSRLKVMHDSTDGFYIAEKDLQLRGPGEVTGIQQSGYLTLGIADPVRDRDLLEIARKEAIVTITNQNSGN
ncbi:MAG: ATP-dependent DNA helicase RecG [Treponema sp. CETP13]|nr:MAG: ATP-dependent DNA helicase RecG [Treponema sp. CETP13]